MVGLFLGKAQFGSRFFVLIGRFTLKHLVKTAKIHNFAKNF